MTETLKVKPYNPVDSMQSDDEVIDYLVDCYKEDKEGLTLARAMDFAEASLGGPRVARLMFFAGMRIGKAEKKAVRRAASVAPSMAM